MSVVRPMRFEPGTFLRTCDICGIRFRANQLVRGEDKFWRCLMYCQEVPQITRDRVIAESHKRREAPPPPNGIPFDRVNTYEVEERILWLLCEIPMREASWPGGIRYGCPPLSSVFARSLAPNGTAVGSGSVAASADACIYLYRLITEAKRPTRWTTPAQTKLVELADWLISRQQGFGLSPSSTAANDPNYGQVIDLSFLLCLTDTQALAGLALLYAHRLLGAAKYLVSAQAVAGFLRNCQAIGSYLTTNFTSSDPAGAVRLYTGGVVRTLVVASNLTSNQQFHPRSLAILQFWRELLTTAGDGNYGAPGTVGGVFTSSPATTLSTMISDLRAFWSVGAFDATTGTTYTGLSATTPRDFFNAYPATHTGFTGRDATGSGSWEFADAGPTTGTTIGGVNFAQALGALYAYEGYSSQVQSVWTWLMSFDSNPSFIAPAGSLPTDYIVVSTNNAANPEAPPVGQGNVVPPAYDPTLALTTTLTVRDSANGYAATKINATAVYDWTTAGLMAGIQASQNASAFRRAKDTVSAVRMKFPPTFTYGDPVTSDFAVLRGQTGLALQFAQGTELWVAQSAARIGNLYRYQPQGWSGTTQPGNQPGLRM